MSTDPPPGPTASQLRARAVAATRPPYPRREREVWVRALERACLACGRDRGVAMCDLCQRLENAEAGAK